MKSAPKDPKQNAAFRRAIIERANKDVAFQEDIWIRCSRDYTFWMDTFAFTYSPKEYPNAPNRPFVLWNYQEDAAYRILNSLGKNDVLIEKSRDMGATWVLLSVYTWRFIFYPRQSFLLGSRKQEYVDKAGDPKSLFWKVMFLLENMPGWLQPNWNKTALHLDNLDNNSTIDGESTNEDFARGDRRTGIGLDEFPAVENGYSILNATRDATKSRVLNGTPQGAAGAYYDTRKKLEQTHPDRIIRMHWSMHPEKQVGLYTTMSGEEGAPLKIIDENYRFPAGYKFILDGKLRSPWYDSECDRAATPLEIAQELDIDYAASGCQFFPAKEIERLEKLHARKPLHEGELSYIGDGEKPRFMPMKGGRLKLWFEPLVNGNVDLNGKPPPDRKFTIGCDIATGKGGEMSSNSVATVCDALTGDVVAMFWSNSIFPSEFAKYTIGLARWFNNAILNWERNGPGNEFTSQVKQTDYRNVYYSEQDESKFEKKKTRQPGWHATKDSKRILLSEFQAAVIGGKFVNPCIESYKEYGEYVHHPNGEISHARSKSSQDPSAIGENHGDHVISQALAYRAMNDVPKVERDSTFQPPPASYQYRRNSWEKRHRKGTLFQESQYARSYF